MNTDTHTRAVEPKTADAVRCKTKNKRNEEKGRFCNIDSKQNSLHSKGNDVITPLAPRAVRSRKNRKGLRASQLQHAKKQKSNKTKNQTPEVPVFRTTRVGVPRRDGDGFVLFRFIYFITNFLLASSCPCRALFIRVVHGFFDIVVVVVLFS